MDVDKAVALVEELAPFGIFLRLIGGEALLHPRWDEVVRQSRELGVPAIVVSNGTRLAREAERLVASGLHVLALSVDFDRELHDASRGDGSFETIREGLRCLERVKAARGSSTPLVEIYSTLHEASHPYLAAWVKELGSWGIDRLRLQHLIWCGPEQLVATRNLLQGAGIEGEFIRREVESYRREEPPAIDGRRLAAQFRDLRSQDLTFELELRPELSEAELLRFHEAADFQRDALEPCKLVDTYAFVDPQGTVFPCLSLAMGNIWERPFFEVWNGERYRAFRRLLRQEKKLPICQRCPAH
jgi:MoaA/NifB/PqqE/SkfB family radical SAM enzyme